MDTWVPLSLKGWQLLTRVLTVVLPGGRMPASLGADGKCRFTGCTPAYSSLRAWLPESCAFTSFSDASVHGVVVGTGPRPLHTVELLPNSSAHQHLATTSCTTYRWRNCDWENFNNLYSMIRKQVTRPSFELRTKLSLLGLHWPWWCIPSSHVKGLCIPLSAHPWQTGRATGGPVRSARHLKPNLNFCDKSMIACWIEHPLKLTLPHKVQQPCFDSSLSSYIFNHYCTNPCTEKNSKKTFWEAFANPRVLSLMLLPRKCRFFVDILLWKEKLVLEDKHNTWGCIPSSY